MIHSADLWAARSDLLSSEGREQQIKEYTFLLKNLIWKRVAAFLGAAVLSAVYFDFTSTVVLYSILLLTEALDLLLERRARAWDGQDPVMGRWILKHILLNTVISATAIGLFVANMAIQQTSGGHFTPLFFLFSASLFAVMYTSQIVSVLLLRLSIYSIAFLFIAFLDVYRYMPPLNSAVWLEFFTVVFVLYFIVDMSATFYRRYLERLDQMRLIKEENKRTKAALEVKSQFLSTVSHELRTPLTSIKASLDLANNGALGAVPEHLKPVMAIAGKNAKRLANLIDDLLDLQKIESGEMAFRFEPVNVNELVAEAVEATSGFATKLRIHVRIAPCATEGRIMGDRSRLMQVMQNLLSNAMKFSSEGSEVEVRVETLGSRIRISVEDQGMGIPNDAKDRVFGKFTQVDSSDNRKVGGTGLGLNISKQIVERHKATIDYVSELGSGSTFFLEFDRLKESDGASAGLEPVAKVA
jgi:signal transduction histidine kinase